MIYAAAYRPEGRRGDRFREHILGRRLLEQGLLREYGRTWEVVVPENGKPFLLMSGGRALHSDLTAPGSQQSRCRL